jgi:hypothetical protein
MDQTLALSDKDFKTINKQLKIILQQMKSRNSQQRYISYKKRTK